MYLRDLPGFPSHRMTSLSLWVGLGSSPEQEPPALPGWGSELRVWALPGLLSLTSQEASCVLCADSKLFSLVPSCLLACMLVT